ncbi:hypothetical protein [Rhodovarius crocodyli]|uniref:hypothetical protein n=1 Tax=Rhodovarius crocodyli TaxID=1979269 RepID=UPI0013E331EF|nr:hypothetical protein [Rhodovarius crocodyli]
MSSELIPLLKELIEEQRRTRLMLARAMAMQLGLANPISREAGASLEKRLLDLDHGT